MRETDAQIVLLIRAFEEADPEGAILPGYRRFAATRRALIITGLAAEPGDRAVTWRVRTGEAVLRRARLLYESLMRDHPELRRVIALADLGVSTTPSVVGGALILGLLTGFVAQPGAIPVLYVPLVALFAWNLLVYFALALAPLTRWRSPIQDSSVRLGELFLRWALGRRLRRARGSADPADEGFQVVPKALLRFGALWHRLAEALLAARVRRMLHLAALAMTAGAVLGLYVWSLATDARVVWHAPWPGRGTLHVLLEAMLGIPAAIGGTPVPDLAPVLSPAGDAPGPWIRLYAGAALLLVGLPRGLLALFLSWRAIRLADRLPVDLDDGYFRRLFAAWRGAAKCVEIVPYAYRPRPAAIDRVKVLLFDYFGARTRVRVHPPLVQGDIAADLVERSVAGDDERCWVVLCSLAETPRRDVHQAFLVDLKSRLGASDQLVVIVDASTALLAEGRDEPWKARMDDWARLVGDAGLTAVELPLQRPLGDFEVTDELVERVRAGLWPGQPQTPEPVAG